MSELRWTLADDAPDRLFDVDRRRPGRGAYAGLTFHEVEAASVLNEVPGAPWGFRWTVNAYRGCSHACVYCFARPTHEYLGFDIADDFDRQIVVKINAVERFRAETDPRVWPGDLVHLGSNTDPYQPAEGRYRLTRGVVETMVERSNPFSILTKSPLVLRDADLLGRAVESGIDVAVSMSVGTLDEDVWRSTEPGTPHPRRRLEALRSLADLGVRVSVLLAPILPGISDGEAQVAAVRRAARDLDLPVSGPVRLHLRTPSLRRHYLAWLGATHPGAVVPTEVALPEPRRRRRQRPSSTVPDGQLSLGV
jgi:DNA repair photolyase